VKSKLPDHPCRVAPIYQPEVGAKALVYAPSTPALAVGRSVHCVRDPGRPARARSALRRRIELPRQLPGTAGWTA